MRIERGQMIVGFPAKKVRDAISRVAFRGSCGCVEFFAKRLGCSKKEGKKFVEEMEAQGYFIRDTRPILGKKIKYYKTTKKGNRLAQARATPPMKRATAKKKVAEIVERAKEINSSEYVYKVVSLVVFGSYLSDSETVNDIDLAIKLDAVHKGGEAHVRAVERAAERSKQCLEFDREKIAWAELEVYRKLRQRSSIYSFHKRDEIENFLKNDENFKYETIYELKSG